MWYTKNIKDVEKELKTNIKTGLKDIDVKVRQDEFGENMIEEGKKESIIIRFIKQFKDFMIIILIIAAIVSAIVSYLENTGDYFDSLIIIAIVLGLGAVGAGTYYYTKTTGNLVFAGNNIISNKIRRKRIHK